MSGNSGGVLGPGPDGLLYICIRGGALEECPRGPGQRNGLGFHTPESALEGCAAWSSTPGSAAREREGVVTLE